MALDRTWYNTLVDDDGSGTVGTVWDKADVDSLMDAIDSELARIDAPWVDYAPTLIADVGTWTSGTKIARYKYEARKCTLIYSIEGSSLAGVTSGGIAMALPVAAVMPPGGVIFSVAIFFLAGQREMGQAGIEVSPYTYLAFHRLGGLTFPADTSAFYVRGQIIYSF